MLDRYTESWVYGSESIKSGLVINWGEEESSASSKCTIVKGGKQKGAVVKGSCFGDSKVSGNMKIGGERLIVHMRSGSTGQAKTLSSIICEKVGKKGEEMVTSEAEVWKDGPAVSRVEERIDGNWIVTKTKDGTGSSKVSSSQVRPSRVSSSKASLSQVSSSKASLSQVSSSKASLSQDGVKCGC